MRFLLRPSTHAYRGLLNFALLPQCSHCLVVGGSFREINWQSGEVNAQQHLIFKDKSSGKYFSTVGLRGGDPILALSENELKERFTVEKVRQIFELVSVTADYTTYNFNELFPKYFLIEKQVGVSTFDALEFYRRLYENSPNFRSLFNFFINFSSFRDIQHWNISIANNTRSRTDFETGNIYIGSDAEIANLYYMGTQGIAPSQPEQVYLHEILHVLTEAKDPEKITAIAHRGPIVYLTDKILSEVGHSFPQRLMYRRPISSNTNDVNSLERYVTQIHSFVAQENSYLDKQLLSKQLNEGITVASQKIFGVALADRYTIKELRSILPDQRSMLIEFDFIALYDRSFSANSEDIHLELAQFYSKFYESSLIFKKLYNQWIFTRRKNKDSSRWHFVVDDATASLAELPLHKRAHCINDLTHRIHIFDDGTLYLSNKGLTYVEKVRQLMHEMVQPTRQ